MRLRALLLPLLAIAPWELPPNNKRLVLDVTFETSKDYDITSAYAVRGWNTTEGHMKITCPSQLAKHGGGYGMEVRVDRAFTKNFHAQFSLPHFMCAACSPHRLLRFYHSDGTATVFVHTCTAVWSSPHGGGLPVRKFHLPAWLGGDFGDWLLWQERSAVELHQSDQSSHCFFFLVGLACRTRRISSLSGRAWRGLTRCARWIWLCVKDVDGMIPQSCFPGA